MELDKDSRVEFHKCLGILFKHSCKSESNLDYWYACGHKSIELFRAVVLGFICFLSWKFIISTKNERVWERLVETLL